MDFFIDITDLKAKSLIHDNTDTKTLTVIMERAQPMYIKSLLGKSTFDDLLAKSVANTLNAVETELVDEWIVPYFIVRTEELATVHFNWEIRNKQVGTASDEYGTANSWQSSDKLDNQFKKQAAYYHTGAREFILDNLDTFTLYTSDCDEVDKETDSAVSIFGSVVNYRG